MPAASIHARVVTALVAITLSVPVAVVATPASATPTKVAVGWPEAARIRLGGSFEVDVRTAASPEDRTVTVQRRVPGGWAAMSSSRLAGSTSTTSLTVRPGWLGRYLLRVAVRPVEAGTTAVSDGFTVRVVPGYRPAGTRGMHDFFTTPVPRWDPCAPIRYRVNLRQARAGALRDARTAFRRVAEATGLRFVYAGRTAMVPQGGLDERFPADTDFVLAWATPARSRLLAAAGGAAGVGGPIYRPGYENGDGSATSLITRGRVVLDPSIRVRPGFGRGFTRGALLMHEIGHAVGLEHARARSQLMYPVLRDGPARYGAGDLAGLERLGAQQGCVYDDGIKVARAR
ncbi:MAG TPA: matrixin family metalloprotease [Nocardioidaceae bacterium]|nr:matrixin family metalloprotease [Nocardioidaceae bacterium]